jgi:hypothetical protein
MNRVCLSSGFLGRLIIMALAVFLAVVILATTAFAQETTTPEPTSQPTATPTATQTPEPTSTPTPTPTPEPTTAPTTPDTSQDCPWEPIQPGEVQGGISGCPWWRDLPGGSEYLGDGQCYDTHIGVIYSCPEREGQEPTTPEPTQQPTTPDEDTSASEIDLAVTDIDPLGQPICAGSDVTFRASIRNNGSRESGFFNIRWIADTTQTFDGGHHSEPAGATGTHDHIWKDLASGEHTLAFIADFDDRIPESDEDNNVDTLTFTAEDCSNETEREKPSTPEKPGDVGGSTKPSSGGNTPVGTGGDGGKSLGHNPYGGSSPQNGVPPLPPGGQFGCVVGTGGTCEGKSIPGRSPKEVEELNRQTEAELKRMIAMEDCGFALLKRVLMLHPVAGPALSLPIDIIRIGLRASPDINGGRYRDALRKVIDYYYANYLEWQAKKLSPKLAPLHLPPACFNPIIWNGNPPDWVKQVS